jgi:thiamine pyrophosphokinase
MNGLLMTNGDYGDLTWYQNRTRDDQWIICADGGTNNARFLGVLPSLVVGDMDSIDQEARSYMEEQGVEFLTVRPEKDFTDTQLALDTFERKGIKRVTIWGGVGDRLDHTLANLLSVVSFVRRGMEVSFESPSVSIYIVTDQLVLRGGVGDIVSVLALGDDAQGVSLMGFQYPLSSHTLKTFEPIGVSNLMVETEAVVQVESGILAVFHNH